MDDIKNVVRIEKTRKKENVIWMTLRMSYA